MGKYRDPKFRPRKDKKSHWWVFQTIPPVLQPILKKTILRKSCGTGVSEPSLKQKVALTIALHNELDEVDAINHPLVKSVVSD